jgi:GNAT superfamily N-acetyltransferase
LAIEIVPYRPEFAAELRAFEAVAYPERFAESEAETAPGAAGSPGSPDPWQWRLAAPVSAEAEATLGREPHVWLLLDGGRIVGQLPTVPTEVRIGGRTWPARMTFDFYVGPEYRNRGAGPLLVRALNREPGLLLNLGPNRAAFPIFERMGWRTVGVLPRAEAVLDLGGASARYGVPAALRPLAGAAGAMAGPLFGLPPEPPRHAPPGPVEEFSRFDEPALAGELEACWRGLSEGLACSFVRSARRLAWRFDDSPAPPAMRLLVRRGRGGPPAGWIVVQRVRRKGVPTGVIAEHVGEPAAAETLLREALRRLRAGGAAVAHARLPHPSMAGLYSRAGFFLRTARRSFVQLMFRPGRDGPARELLARPGNWFITLADGDVDW